MKTEVVETRVDICRLAECALAFEQQGIALKSKSSLVAACIDGLSSILINNSAVPSVEDEHGARKIVKRVLSPKPFDAGSLKLSSIQQQVLSAAKQFNNEQEKESDEA